MLRILQLSGSHKICAIFHSATRTGALEALSNRSSSSCSGVRLMSYVNLISYALPWLCVTDFDEIIAHHKIEPVYIRISVSILKLPDRIRWAGTVAALLAPPEVTTTTSSPRTSLMISFD